MNSNKNKSIDKNKTIYKENVETDGVTKNVVGEQTIKTTETKILKNSDGKEVLIGKDIEEIEDTKEGYDTLQKRIIEKLMK